MNFSSADKVQATIRQGDYIAQLQSSNRARVNDLFNGLPPLSPAEAEKMNVRVNINWGEAAVLGQHGRRQYKTAFLSPQNFFKVTLPNAPIEKQLDWGTYITQLINRPMKKNRKYASLHRYKWTTVLIHGIGPQLWYDKDNWCPDYVALNDLRIATDTTTDFENLNWFAVRHRYSVGELAKKVWGKHADSGWSKPLISKLLDSRKDINWDNPNGYNWITAPERMAELIKQNGGYYNSDAVPIIPLWHFYFKDDDDVMNVRWKLRVVPDVQSGALATESDRFLYDTEKPAADELSQLLHCQFGDLNVDAPFMYHSVRALGFELMEPCYFTNLTRCRWLQHIHESMNVWLRVVDPQGKARAQKMELYDRAVIPEGVSIVPQTERHQIPSQQVEALMQELRQLMAEASVSYTQDIESGGANEETATKTMAKVNQVNAMLGGLLDDAFTQEIFAYQEIARRFCIPNSTDKDVQTFQKKCLARGIPKQFLDVDEWDIEPERPLGNGNPTMAQAKAQALFGIRQVLSPTAQREVDHTYIEVMTDNPRLADRLAPLNDAQKATPAQKVAEADFATLIRGLPVNVMETAVIEQAPVILGLLAGEIALLEQNGNVADPREVQGLNAVVQHLTLLIGQLAQDPSQRETVNQFKGQLSKLQNTIRGFEQRAQEQMNSAAKESISLNYKDAPADVRRQIEAKAGFVPSQLPESQVEPQTLKAVHSLAVKTVKEQQASEHKNAGFQAEQDRLNQAAIAEQARKNMAAEADLANKKEASQKEPKTPQSAPQQA